MSQQTQTNMTEWSSIQAQRAHLEEVMDFCPSTLAIKDKALKTFDQKFLFPYISTLVGETIEMPSIRDTNVDIRRDTNVDIRSRPRPSTEVRKRCPYRAKRKKYDISKQEVWAALRITGYITSDIISEAREHHVEIEINSKELSTNILNDTNRPKFQQAVTAIQHNLEQRTLTEERTMLIQQLWRNKTRQKPMKWRANINNVLAEGLTDNDYIEMTPTDTNVWKLRIMNL